MDLTPLVVLVGPNGVGKTTVLEALFIAASPDPSPSVEQIVRRHETGGTRQGWLLWKEGREGDGEITVTTETGLTRRCTLTPDRSTPANETTLTVRAFEPDGSSRTGWIAWSENKKTGRSGLSFAPLNGLKQGSLVEGYPASTQEPLHALYSEASRQGRRQEALDMVRGVLPEIVDLEIQTESAVPVLFMDFGSYSVPATLSGDGLQTLLRLSLSLAVSAGGLALLEEPEVHQHPGAIRQNARVILAAVRRGIQVVLTTYSLEIIDALLGESLDADQALLCLYRLKLQQGSLNYSRLDGAEVAFARTEIQDDLR
jgi:hypothetical protein